MQHPSFNQKKESVANANVLLCRNTVLVEDSDGLTKLLDRVEVGPGVFLAGDPATFRCIASTLDGGIQHSPETFPRRPKFSNSAEERLCHATINIFQILLPMLLW